VEEAAAAGLEFAASVGIGGRDPAAPAPLGKQVGSQPAAVPGRDVVPPEQGQQVGQVVAGIVSRNTARSVLRRRGSGKVRPG
jgi:hypothetical protein